MPCQASALEASVSGASASGERSTILISPPSAQLRAVMDPLFSRTMRSGGPLPQRAKQPLTARVALLGDAGLFYDQITGEGLSLALLQAELVADTLGAWDTAAGRDTFTHSIQAIAKQYISVTDLAMFFTRHPAIRSLVIRYLGRTPKLFAHMLHSNMGEGSIYRPPLGILLQGLLSPKREDADECRARLAACLQGELD